MYVDTGTSKIMHMTFVFLFFVL
jgi:hypothetical protein